MTTKFGSKMRAGAFAASLLFVVTACGGDDGGGGGGVSDEVRAELRELIAAGGLPEETVECLVDAAVDSFSDGDLEAVLAGGEPGPEAEAKFTEKAVECSGVGG